jgi:hypothetical protein
MIRFMNLMHFPRYVRTESRDFFYLTERPLLPLPALKAPIERPEPGEGIWQTKSLSQQGWPAAIATTRYRPDPSLPNMHATLIAIDCKWIQLAKRAESKSPTIFSIEPNEPSANSTSLWFTKGTMKLQTESPGNDARRLASGTEDPKRIVRAGGAMGQLNGQIWVYVELSGGSDRARDVKTYERVLNEVGAHQRLYFGQPINMKLDGRMPTSSTSTGFMRQQGPHGMRIFEDTPIVSPKVWMPLQEKRLRYTKQPKAARPLADGSETAEATPGSKAKIPDPPVVDPATEKEP